MYTWGGIGRGTGDSSAPWSGVCRTLARARRYYPSPFDPDWCAAPFYISEARGEPVWIIGMGPEPGLGKRSRGDEKVPLGRLLPPKSCAQEASSSFPNSFSTKVGA